MQNSNKNVSEATTFQWVMNCGNSNSDEYKSEHNGEIAAHYPRELALVQDKDLL